MHGKIWWTNRWPRSLGKCFKTELPITIICILEAINEGHVKDFPHPWHYRKFLLVLYMPTV